MAQETNIVIQVSDDGVSGWLDIATQAPDSIGFIHTGVAPGSTKYYRTIAKGDGLNTLDSDPSLVVSITNGYSTGYQAVLDYAIANTIVTPSLSQNIINDTIYRKLKWEGILDKCDLFYYFKQEAGLQEFVELNWVSPGNFTLYNETPSLVPTYAPGSGIEHNADDKFYKTGYVPSVNATNLNYNNASFFFKLYNYPTTYSSLQRIFGGRTSGGNNQVLCINNASGTIIRRLFTNSPNNYNFSQADINSHFCFTRTNTDERSFKNGEIDLDQAIVNGGVLDSAELAVLGHNENGTWYGNGTGGMEYFGLGANIRFNVKELYRIQTGTYYDKKVNFDGVVNLTTTDTTPQTIYWLRVYKTSDFPNVTCDTPYFCLYSTNHAAPSSDGGIYWAKINSPKLDGFVEQGAIVSDYQSETPDLHYVPDDPDGHTLHLYYHPDASHPDSGGYQQTRLLTSTGGVLHTASYTDRGKIFGMVNPGTDETHTGYPLVFNQGGGNFVALHATSGLVSPTESGIANYGKSVSSDYGRTYTRVTSDYDRTSFMGFGTQYLADPATFFTRNTQQYIIAGNTPYDFVTYTQHTRVSIYTATDYLPTALVGNISLPNAGNGFFAMSSYVEGNTAYIYYVNEPNVYYTTWNLTSLD